METSLRHVYIFFFFFFLASTVAGSFFDFLLSAFDLGMKIPSTEVSSDCP
jgi:hypothetical protein